MALFTGSLPVVWCHGCGGRGTDAAVRLGCGCGSLLRRCGCVTVAVTEWGPPRPWPVLTVAHGQPFFEQHWRCRRAGPGRGAAGQHDADDAGVRLGCGCGCECYLRRCGCIAVVVTEREPHDLGQCSHLHMDSVSSNSIGDAGARDLGAALRVNTTLTMLM